MMTPFLRCGHQRIEAPRHIDIAEHLQIPSGAPARLVDLRDVAARDGAGIVDQEIGVGTFGGELVDIAAVGEIERIKAHRDIVLGDDRCPCRFEIGCGARHQTTSQPSSANTSAQARPMPCEAPVTSALRPLNPSSIAFSLTKVDSAPIAQARSAAAAISRLLRR